MQLEYNKRLLVSFSLSQPTHTVTGVMYRVYDLRLVPNFIVRLAAVKIFYLRLTVEKMHALQLLAINICSHTAVVTQILRLQLIVQI